MQIVHFHHVGGSPVCQRRQKAVAIGLTCNDGGFRSTPQIPNDVQDDLDWFFTFPGDRRSEPVQEINLEFSHLGLGKIAVGTGARGTLQAGRKWWVRTWQGLLR